MREYCSLSHGQVKGGGYSEGVLLTLSQVSKGWGLTEGVKWGVEQSSIDEPSHREWMAGVHI